MLLEFFSFLKRTLFEKRLNTLILVMVLFAVILFGRLFDLQIVRGKDFQDNYRLKVERQEVIDATRGNIYDKNGNLLAYNKLVNAVVIEDAGTYKNDRERNEKINGDLAEIIANLDRIGDPVYVDFGISLDENNDYVFNLEGTRLNRFRADIFGHSSIDELKYNSRLDINEATASAEEIMAYLCDRRYAIDENLDKSTRYRIAMVRYRMGLNSYQKYISTIVASDVSPRTVAYIMENKYKFTGVNIDEQSLRVYDNPECFSNILGYTGTISIEEYDKLSESGNEYTLNDIVGKAGIEQYMNYTLMGKKGYQTVYVDSLGNLLETADIVNQQSGNDVYLSIDKDLTINTYNILEQQIAGILYSKIENIKEYESGSGSDDIIIPIYDVYNAFVSNRILNITKKDKLTDAETAVYNSLNKKLEEVINSFSASLYPVSGIVYEELDKENQAYSTYVVKKLKSDGVFDANLIDNNDDMQKLWTSEKLSVNEYLRYAIDKGWINIAGLVDNNEYVDTSEVYRKLIDYCMNFLHNENDFKRTVFYYALLQDRIDLGALCAMLYDQGVFPPDEETRTALIQGSLQPYDFVKDKIKTLQLTPGQLGLDPCSGSCVVMDPQNGSLLALVTYPGYDNNRLSNNLDSTYYSYLNNNKSSPLYNHATQERTAPGSTYKLLSSTAALAEGVINLETEIKDEGIYTKVSNNPRCWIYPSSTHGLLDIVGAIRDSCNFFFYEVGHLLAGDVNYNDKRGINKLKQYAQMYGLTEKTGIEIEESTPEVATEYPVMAAIGQSNNNFTTVSLARYVSAVANNGTVYNLTLLSKVVSKDGELLESYGPDVKNTIDVLDGEQWGSIHEGMKQVVENSNAFKDFAIPSAGKTGTAQQVPTRPNHALFVGYAPYNYPKIAIACRISFGYTSANAASVARRVIGTYLNEEEYAQEAVDVSANNRFTD